MRPNAVQRLELPKAWRYRCFGRRELPLNSCGRAASWRAPDPSRHDAMTFWCDGCRPELAEKILDGEPFMAVGVAVVLTIGGATAPAPEAIREAKHAVEAALAGIGCHVQIVGAEAGLMMARTIIGQNTPPDRPGGPESDEGKRGGG